MGGNTNMPYSCALDGRKWKLTGNNKTFGTHATKRACEKQMRALYANEVKNEAHINLTGPIRGGDYYFDWANLEGDTVNVVIDSPGGSVSGAISLHNQLVSSGKKVRVYVIGSAHSSAAFAMLSGNEIYIAENASVMFHPPALKFDAGDTLTSDELKDRVSSLEVVTNQLVATLQSRTKMTEEECKAFLSKETWLTPNEALALGIVDEVIPILRDVEIEDYFPVNIVNFVKGKQQMPLKEVCEQVGIEFDEDNAEESLIKYINSLKAKLPAKPMEVSTSIVNMIKKSREGELNTLLVTGKVTPTVVNEMKVKFLGDEKVKSDLQTEDTEFDNIVNVLAKNEEIISFKSKSGVQALAKDEEQKKHDDNVLIRDVELRLANAKG